MSYVSKPTRWQPYRKGNRIGRVRIGVGVRLKSDFQSTVFAKQVLALFIYKDKRTFTLDKAEDANADPLFSVILDQPGFVSASLRWEWHGACGDRQCICDCRAILETQ